MIRFGWSKAKKYLSLSFFQCDQIRRILKIVTDKYSFKCSPNVGQPFREHHFLNTNSLSYFLSNLWWKIWLFFSPTSGHIAVSSEVLQQPFYGQKRTKRRMLLAASRSWKYFLLLNCTNICWKWSSFCRLRAGGFLKVHEIFCYCQLNLGKQP